MAKEKVYTCQSCGHTSIAKSEFEKYNGILACDDCIRDHEQGEDPAYTWVEQAIKNQP